jgi:hypothetical protein
MHIATQFVEANVISAGELDYVGLGALPGDFFNYLYNLGRETTKFEYVNSKKKAGGSILRLTFNLSTCKLVGMVRGPHASSVDAQQGFAKL